MPPNSIDSALSIHYNILEKYIFLGFNFGNLP